MNIEEEWIKLQTAIEETKNLFGEYEEARQKSLKSKFDVNLREEMLKKINFYITRCEQHKQAQVELNEFLAGKIYRMGNRKFLVPMTVSCPEFDSTEEEKTYRYVEEFDEY